MAMPSDAQTSTLVVTIFAVSVFVFLWRTARLEAATRKMEERPYSIRDSVLLFLTAAGLILFALPILWFGADYGFPAWSLKLVVAGVPLGLYLIFVSRRHRKKLDSLSNTEKRRFYREQAQMKRWSEKFKLKGR
jgi:hypothetical protein